MKNPLMEKTTKYQHIEAYRFIWYVGMNNEGKKITKILWNSRDGIVPLLIYNKNGRHILGGAKLGNKKVNHVLKKSELYIASMTKERAKYLVKRLVSGRWNHPIHPLSKQYESKKIAIFLLFKDYYGEGNNPTVLKHGNNVTTYMTKHFENFVTPT